MADEKKKEAPAGWDFDLTETIILLIIFLSIASTVIPALISYISSGRVSFYGVELAMVYRFFGSNAQLFKIFGYLVAGLAAAATFVLTKKGDALWRIEKSKVYPDIIETPQGEVVPVRNPLLERWNKVQELSQSENPSEMRLAIIEADIILDELLEKLRLPGNTMGEKLKAVEPSDFTTIESAWEAHKTRNLIAHEGSDFLLNQREVRRVISLYEAVFKEFNMI